ncbi:TonB-dependent SusC/RagA subfamily outer membrane receptor [Pedobacter sp. UYP30]|uniref:alpha-2-macroglobulin family protein n=1 Tax=Pedobacter sp. UYP30 TaxID=1756400 RepID=UPI00339434EF
MLQKIIFALSIFMLLNLCAALAQTNIDYSSSYKKIDSLEKKGLVSSARKIALRLFANAVKTKNDPQQLKAAIYIMSYRNAVEEGSRINNYFYLDTLISETKTPAKNILQSLQAEMLNDYKARNRYKFYNRTALQEENSKDIATWSLPKLLETISAKYLASLQSEKILQNTSIQNYKAIINKGSNTEGLRPTIYDLLAHRAIDFFVNSENDVTKPADQFLINDEQYFAPVGEFAKLTITAKDSASFYLQALHIFQHVFSFHLADGNKAALADADLKRLAFVNQHGVFTHKNELYLAALKKLEEEFIGTEQGAEAAYLIASNFNALATDQNDSLKLNNVKAKSLAEELIKNYPKTQAALKAQNLINDIISPQLSLSAEAVNTINNPFRLLVTYKNIDKIYLRVVKVTPNFLRDNPNNWDTTRTFTPLKQWEQPLPSTKDFMLHSTEIKVDGLPSGQYYILASINPSFKKDANLISYQLTSVSNISEILHNNTNELFVVDRNTGKPLEGTEVQLWQRSYNYQTRKYSSIKREKYTTNRNGFVQLSQSKSLHNASCMMQFNYQNDELFANSEYFLYYGNNINGSQKYKAFLFTDRSIYRPGQTVFFKGIMVGAENGGKRDSVVKDKSTTVILYDANGQKQGSIELTTNAFGSYNGSFVLPQGQLNGQFCVQDSVTNSQVYFSVEEYKRPKFSVEIKQPEGTYRVNDSITVVGNAKAFAGNNVDGAAVKYRVVRKVQYPIWWGWRRPFGQNTQMEITNGTIETDAKGEFKLTFKAIPDETVEKKAQPTFTYEISADVTDINGETHSGNTDVAVKYQALSLSIKDPEKLEADSLKDLKVNSSNTNGVFEKATVNLQVEKLLGNTEIYRSRYWQQPDQFAMSAEEFHTYFPYDEYKDESKVQTWAIEKSYPAITADSQKDGSWDFKNLDLSEGWYRFTATAKDKYGEEVKDIKYIQLTGKKTVVTVPFIAKRDKEVYQPGEKIQYEYQTAFKNIWVIEETKKTQGETTFNFVKVSENTPYKSSLQVSETDRGGIFRSQAFVQHNRMYNFAQVSDIPWSNKVLSIDYTTFRDNILPGSKEKWSVKISGEKKDAVAAEALISMYDASLDQLEPHSWQSLQNVWKSLSYYAQWNSRTFTQSQSRNVNNWDRTYLRPSYFVYPSIINSALNESPAREYLRASSSDKISGAPGYRGSIEDIPVSSAEQLLQGKVAGLNISEEKNLNEVVVVGYGTQRKLDLTGAVSQMKIRGESTQSGQSPLYIIDGVITKLKDIAEVNPADIASIEVLKDSEATAVYGSQGANGVIIITTKTGKYTLVKLYPSADIKIRKNFNETAFFFPDLKTDEEGNISFSFTMPEALTKWKMMTMAHTQDLQSVYGEKTLITQKPLMIQPNAPRFLREGDALEFSAKIVNLTDKEIKGTSALQLFDAVTDKPVDGLFENVSQNQKFTVAAGQSVAVKFPIAIPLNFNSALSYRITAQSVTKDSTGNTFSDGEQAAIPVLTNRMLVTESLPLNVRNTNSKSFTFDKLVNSGKNSITLTNEALTVEYTSNPAWYAVQALPYLMDYPYECAEQSFNRYYANTLASYVASSTPKLKAVFDKWAALGAPSPQERAGGEASNLQKNEELKSALLQETPWVLQAKSEAEQKKNIGILFNMTRLAKEKSATFNKLREMQSPNGGFSWFKGGPDDRYITQYIITGIGHLRKLKALSDDDYYDLKTMVNKALPYLDARLNDDYQDLIKYKRNLAENNLSNTAVQFLYMRSFFPEMGISTKASTAYKYYEGQAEKYWLKNNKYTQAMIALALHRIGKDKTPKAIIASLKETAINSEEMGMYWKDLARGGWYWYQAPIESQAMIIEAFTAIDKNEATVNDLKTWLLKQKQTQNWRTTKATAEACYALLLNGSNWLAEEKNVNITLGENTVISSSESAEAGTGYFKKRIEGSAVNPEMGNIKVNITSTGATSNSTSWGAVYWQYFEDLDKITSAETPLKLVKKLFVETNSDKGPVITEIKDGASLHIGDKLKVRIELRSDRDMEYVHMKDMRASATEPINVISSYKYQDGLGYYESTKDASTNFFFSRLPKGTYVFEYPLFVTHSGNFSNGIISIQCMYAPEFSSHSEGIRIKVAE